MFYNLSRDKDTDIWHLTKEKSNEFEKLSSACVKYFYGKRLADHTQVDIKHFIFNVITKLSNNTSIDEVINIMKKDLEPEQNLISQKIDDEDFGRVKTPLIHILAYHYSNQKYIHSVQTEHILPKKWINFEFAQWGWTEETVKQNIERIGNLVLIEGKLNSAANNHILKLKQERAYSKSEFKSFEKLINITEWTPNELEKRTIECKSILKKFFRDF